MEQEWSKDKRKDDGIDRGEIRTVFSTSIDTVRLSGKRMCEHHEWTKVNDTEIACKNCPTQLIVGIDDERL